MRQQAVVFDGHIEVREYPGAVVRESAFVKPIYIYIGDIERAIVENKIPISKPIVLGSTGIVRVLEVISNETEYTGKVYTVSAMGFKGILGVDEDGILATYSSIHPSYLDEQLLEPSPIDALRPIVRHSIDITRLVDEPALVEGCGVIGISTGLILRYMGMEPMFYCEEMKRGALAYGFTVASHISEISKRWNTIVLTGINNTSKHRVLKTVEFSKLVISRMSFTKWIPLPDSSRSYKVYVVNRGGLIDEGYVRRVLSELSKNIKIHILSSLESLIGLLPPKGLGYVISIG